jgi:UDP-glucuronate 4-epimerase
MTKTVLVTGGAGFIGSHLVDALLERGDRVICIDNFNDFYSPARKERYVAAHSSHPNYTLLRTDIRSREAIMDAFEEHHPSHVAHLAAMANVRYSIERGALYSEVNVQGTVNILDAARKVNAENVLIASTSAIYGKVGTTPFTEDMPVNKPLAPYPATKKAAELLAHSYHHLFDMNINAVRFFNVYGPRVRPDTIAWIVMQAIIQNEPFTLYDHGEFYRDWTYIDDIIRGTLAALDTPLGYEIINLGRGEPIRLGDFVEEIERIVGKPAPVIHMEAPASEVPITYASVEKAKRLLGYAPKVSVSDGLRPTWDWFNSLRE